MTRRITINAQPVEPITLELVGKEYLVKPPKGALGIKIAQQATAADEDPAKLWEIVEGYIEIAFGKKQAQKVKDRLFDNEDLLDVVHIMELIQQLTESVTDVPSS